MPPTRNITSSSPASNITEPEDIPRPSNSFILFRKDYNDGNPTARRFTRPEHKPLLDAGARQPDISKIASAAWNGMTKEQKEPWYKRQEEVKAEHETKYPGYKYSPGSKKKGKKTRRTMQSNRSVNNEEASPTLEPPPSFIIDGYTPFLPVPRHDSQGRNSGYATSGSSSRLRQSLHHEMPPRHEPPFHRDTYPNRNTLEYHQQMYHERADHFEQSQVAGSFDLCL
ncbi:hypothetical protein MPER_12197 [Moniliophthora perniciosa FA553]|nr:hypothetical protein MPER_12197 [Moniliophthora perniciosa FA553]